MKRWAVGVVLAFAGASSCTPGSVRSGEATKPARPAWMRPTRAEQPPSRATRTAVTANHYSYDSSCGPKEMAEPLLTIPPSEEQLAFVPTPLAEVRTYELSQWHRRSSDVYEDSDLRHDRDLRRARRLGEGWLIGASQGHLLTLSEDHTLLWARDTRTGKIRLVVETSLGGKSDTMATAAASANRLFLGYTDGAVAELDLSPEWIVTPVRNTALELASYPERLYQLWTDAELVLQLHSDGRFGECTDLVAARVAGNERFHAAKGHFATCGELLDSGRMLLLSNAPAPRAWVLNVTDRTIQQLNPLPLDRISCGSIRDGQVVVTGHQGKHSIVAVQVNGAWRSVVLGSAIGELPVSARGPWIAVGDPTIGVIDRGRTKYAAGVVHLLKVVRGGVQEIARISAQEPTESALWGRQVLIDSGRLYVGEAGSRWFLGRRGSEPAVSIYELN